MAPAGYDYVRYSRLAGPVAPAGQDYRVRYRSLLAREPHRVRALALIVAAPVLSAVLLVWLISPGHWTRREGAASGWLAAADTLLLTAIALIEFFRLLNVVSIAHATLVACDPVPVRPRKNTRVAFLTTYVPGKEPISMVRATLTGAVRVRHRGPLDVWLLDEGDDPEARALCAELGVRHFTRRGVPEWNRPRGPFRARTKHGNYNAWLEAHGDAYDFFAGVDTDHVPLPAYLERMLGYFRDPDVAFVVGPQVYGNYDRTVTRFAESQQFLFHALIQRAGNRYGAPMLVGTNNVVRIEALRGVGRLCDSITEDMATGFEIHRRRNPRTGNRWRSVYTPDVLAVGEGPASWTDFFTQQLRWSRGTFETLLRQYGRPPHRHSAGRLLHYSLMLAYYPMSAATWVLGGVSCVLFLWAGASGVTVRPEVWLMLYGDAAALQVGLYLWNRRHNVSPHEPEGSGGLAGMVMSALAAPIYARSLGAALLRRPCRFVVTPKGGSASLDGVRTFRTHLAWAVLLGASLAGAWWLDREYSLLSAWAVLAFAVALAPPLCCAASVCRARWRPTSPPREEAGAPSRAPAVADRVSPASPVEAPSSLAVEKAQA